MNRNQMKGAAKDVAGKVQREAGKAMDSPRHEAKGAARQAEGKVQKAAGDLQQPSGTRRKTTPSR